MSTQPKLGVSGILCRAGKVLLGLRSSKDESLPGMWCTPGGGVEYGEPLNVALKREFLEETGIDVDVDPWFISIQERIHDTKHSVLIFKQVILVSGTPKPLDGFDDIQWFDIPQLRIMFGENKVTQMSQAAIEDFLSL